MFARLIAKNTDQTAGVDFDYQDVFRVARATFSGNHHVDSKMNTLWNDSQSSRTRCLEHNQECWQDWEEHDLRRADSSYRHHGWRSPSPFDYVPHDSHHQ